MTSFEGASTITRLRVGRLEELYAIHSAPTVRLAYLLTGDGELAQDLAQEAFVRVAGRFGALRSDASFTSYLRSTLYNLTRSHFRKLRVEREHIARSTVGEVADHAPASVRRQDLRDELMALPLRQRAALVLRYFEDLSEEQAAHAMDCTVPAIRSLTDRGLKTLRLDEGRKA
jgi:RNA polymerase sigma factor (sigma-70 family)